MTYYKAAHPTEQPSQGIVQPSVNVLDWLGTRSDARLQEYRFRRHDDMEVYSVTDEDSQTVFGQSFFECLQQLSAISRSHSLPDWAVPASGGAEQSNDAAQLAKAKALMQLFVDRVERGEVRSYTTYNTFKEFLGQK